MRNYLSIDTLLFALWIYSQFLLLEKCPEYISLRLMSLNLASGKQLFKTKSDEEYWLKKDNINAGQIINEILPTLAKEFDLKYKIYKEDSYFDNEDIYGRLIEGSDSNENLPDFINYVITLAKDTTIEQIEEESKWSRDNLEDSKIIKEALRKNIKSYIKSFESYIKGDYMTNRLVGLDVLNYGLQKQIIDKIIKEKIEHSGNQYLIFTRNELDKILKDKNVLVLEYLCQKIISKKFLLSKLTLIEDNRFRVVPKFSDVSIHIILNSDEQFISTTKEVSDSLYSIIYKAKITPKEEEVLGYLIQGDKNKKIAERAVLSLNTVKNHVDSIAKKINGLLAMDLKPRDLISYIKEHYL